MGLKLSPFPHYLLLTGLEASMFNSGSFILYSSKRSLVIVQMVLNLVYVIVQTVLNLGYESMVFSVMEWGPNSLCFFITNY